MPYTIGNSNGKKTPQEARTHGVVVSHPLRMRKALGSNPSVSRLLQQRVQLGNMWHMRSGQARPRFLPAMDTSEDPTNSRIFKTCAGACSVGHMV